MAGYLSLTGSKQRGTGSGKVSVVGRRKSTRTPGVSNVENLTKDQETRAAVLLLSSDSPAAFVLSCVVKERDGVVGAAEMYQEYQEWCKTRHLQPFNSKQFSQTSRHEIEMGLGLRLRHDLETEGGGCMRGWRGLGLVEALEVQEVEKASQRSAV